MYLEYARPLAWKLVEALAPACKRIEVAGSIRRGKAEVKDIEIVAQPESFMLPDLFGSETPYVNEARLEGFLAGLERDGWLHPLKGDHRYKQFKVTVPGWDAINLDLFIVLPPAQWGVIFTLRTGPDLFSKRLVTIKRWGGLLPSNMQVKHGGLYRNGHLIETPDEFTFFREAALEWVDPCYR